ncbi:MAG: DNA polymerase III subunit beta [Pseudomonadota bacterium]
MRIEFDRDQLTKGLLRIGTVVERKTTMPVLGNVLLEAAGKSLHIIATDLETTIESECPVKVLEEGKVCIPARNLIDIVKELPERVGRLKKGENEWMLLESGKAQFRVVGVPAEKFPRVTEPGQFKFMKIRTETLRDGIEKTSFAISTDEMRYNLNGAYVETIKDAKGKNVLRMVTTDGHRLALSDQELGDDENLQLKKGVILPRKGVTELKRLLAETQEPFADIGFGDNSAAVRLEGATVYMRLVVGEFPDYKAVIPKTNKKKLVIDRALFTHSLRRVSLFSEGKSKCVRLGLKGDGVHLAANSPDLGEAEEELRAEFDGGELQIGFNARYLLDALSVAVGDKVVLELDQETSPGLIKIPDDPGFCGVIMPMRI